MRRLYVFEYVKIVISQKCVCVCVCVRVCRMAIAYLELVLYQPLGAVFLVSYHYRPPVNSTTVNMVSLLSLTVNVSDFIFCLSEINWQHQEEGIKIHKRMQYAIKQ